jgi:hypothetical protein
MTTGSHSTIRPWVFSQHGQRNGGGLLVSGPSLPWAPTGRSSQPIARILMSGRRRTSYSRRSIDRRNSKSFPSQPRTALAYTQMEPTHLARSCVPAGAAHLDR